MARFCFDFIVDDLNEYKKVKSLQEDLVAFCLDTFSRFEEHGKVSHVSISPEPPIYKTRWVCKSKNSWKADGYRIYYAYYIENHTMIPIAIYIRKTDPTSREVKQCCENRLTTITPKNFYSDDDLRNLTFTI